MCLVYFVTHVPGLHPPTDPRLEDGEDGDEYEDEYEDEYGESAKYEESARG